MIDIHSHILPFLDDGAESVEQAVAMLKIAEAEGITSIIATPHYYGFRKSVTPMKVQESLALIQKELVEKKINIHLYTGNEIYYRRDVEEELERGQMNTLAGSPYVLTEFHPGEDYDYIRMGLNSLSRYGYYPILAHVERYEALFSKKGRIFDIKNSGVQLQINASSVTAKGFGNTYRKRAMLLLKEQIADYVATDAHSDGHRAPKVRECEWILRKKAGNAYTEELLIGNAEQILQMAGKYNTSSIMREDK